MGDLSILTAPALNQIKSWWEGLVPACCSERPNLILERGAKRRHALSCDKCLGEETICSSCGLVFCAACDLDDLDVAARHHGSRCAKCEQAEDSLPNKKKSTRNTESKNFFTTQERFLTPGQHAPDEDSVSFAPIASFSRAEFDALFAAVARASDKGIISGDDERRVYDLVAQQDVRLARAFAQYRVDGDLFCFGAVMRSIVRG